MVLATQPCGRQDLRRGRQIFGNSAAGGRPECKYATDEPVVASLPYPNHATLLSLTGDSIADLKM
jgi:hypothetical protein